MIVLLSLLLVAFLFGIWMGLSFYRRVAIKSTVNIPITRRFAKTRSGTYQG
ncbi:MAG TPA: hypothetical protein VKX41_12030 [Alloacidobacterium sp.]|nr:hypothetical protein [Alloacidobacterium sp.]